MTEKEIIIQSNLIVREGEKSAQRTKAELSNQSKNKKSIATLLDDEEKESKEDSGAAE